VRVILAVIEPLMPVLPEELRVRVERARHERPKELRDSFKEVEQVGRLTLGTSGSLVTPQYRGEWKGQRFEPRFKALLLVQGVHRPPDSRRIYGAIPKVALQLLKSQTKILDLPPYCRGFLLGVQGQKVDGPLRDCLLGELGDECPAQHRVPRLAPQWAVEESREELRVCSLGAYDELRVVVWLDP